MNGEIESGRIYFQWFFSAYRVARPYVNHAWWDTGEEFHTEKPLSAVSLSPETDFVEDVSGETTSQELSEEVAVAEPPSRFPVLPTEAARSLRIWVPAYNRAISDTMPFYAAKASISLGGLMSQRIMDDLRKARVSVPSHECEFVNAKPAKMRRRKKGVAPPPVRMVPVREGRTHYMPPYHYLAPVAALDRRTGEGWPYPRYTGLHEIFTQTDRRALYCTFKVAELARSKRWTNTRMVMCLQDRSLIQTYGKRSLELDLPLSDRDAEWPPKCVQAMLALGYRL